MNYEDRVTKEYVEGLIAGGLKFEMGRYQGTGTKGAEHPNTLSFSFAPKIVLLHRENGTVRMGVFFQGETTAYIPYIDTEVVEMVVAWSNDGKTLSWYATRGTEDHQMNHTAHHYRYYALG